MNRIEWLNSLRGVAAFLVVLAHLLAAFFMLNPWAAGCMGLPELELPVAARAPWTVVAFAVAPLDVAGMGVCTFFLVSGFVIARSIERYSRLGFLVGRIMRILPTYAAGYALVAAVVAGLQVVRNGHTEVRPADVLIGMFPGLPTLIGVATIPNGVVWTLIVEIVFYAIVLVAYRALTGSLLVPILIGIGCAVLQQLLLQLVGVNVPAVPGAAELLLVALPFIPILLVGTVFSGLADTRTPSIQVVATIGGLFMTFLWMSEFPLWGRFFPFGQGGAGTKYRLTFLVTIVLFAGLTRMGPRWTGNPLSSWMADVSYPLYVIHLMVGWAMLFLLYGAGVNVYLGLVVTVVCVYLVAWLLHLGVEAPSHRWGRRVARRLTPATNDPGRTRPGAIGTTAPPS